MLREVALEKWAGYMTLGAQTRRPLNPTKVTRANPVRQAGRRAGRLLPRDM